MTKKARYNKIMEEQQVISSKRLESCVDKNFEVLIESKSFDGKWYIGRSYMDVPDIDGVIYVKASDEDLQGKFINVNVTEVRDYDLIGKII